MAEIEWWEFDAMAELAEQVAGDITFVVESAIEAHGGARIALPGGRTPEPIFKRLTASKIDWTKVTVLPTDERLVPLNDPLSNLALLVRHFGGEGAKMVPLVEEAALSDYQEAGRRADQRLAGLAWPLDLVWLGMGADGHTASIFPGPDLDRAIAGPKGRRAVGVRPDPLPPEAPVDRVTLTLDAFSSARAVMIVIAGQEKREVLERAIEEGPLSTTPIGRVIANLDVPIDVFWSAS